MYGRQLISLRAGVLPFVQERKGWRSAVPHDARSQSSWPEDFVPKP